MNPPTLFEHGARKCLVLTAGRASQVDLASLPASFDLGEPFVCVIWDAIGGAPGEERLAFGRSLVGAGCRYAVCGGEDCSAWHDAVDLAFEILTLDLSERERHARFLMTTWHEGEPVEEVVWFAFTCTNFGEVTFRRWLVVIRGGDEALRRRFERALAADVGIGSGSA